MAKVANRKNLTDLLDRKPRCLHISCHGIQNSEKNFPNNLRKDNGDYLLFEGENQGRDLVPYTDLKQITS